MHNYNIGLGEREGGGSGFGVGQRLGGSCIFCAYEFVHFVDFMIDLERLIGRILRSSMFKLTFSRIRDANVQKSTFFASGRKSHRF